jgi:cystathionine beta-lyase/cystathionine gamma-synthase
VYFSVYSIQLYYNNQNKDMTKADIIQSIEQVLNNLPEDWINLTTHRLDIYHEDLAKVEFLEHFEQLINSNNISQSNLDKLPTAYDYIRLGHPLSSVLEWAIAEFNGLQAKDVISFSSNTMPILAVLRKNLFDNINTQILYNKHLPDSFDEELIKSVYGYHFEIKRIDNQKDITDFDGEQVFVSQHEDFANISLIEKVDYQINILENYGSILMINLNNSEDAVSAIQHVRRRETIAMTPSDSFLALNQILNRSKKDIALKHAHDKNKQTVEELIKDITYSPSKPLIGSSGLSVQYAIMMGLIHHAIEHHPGKNIKIIVPPNCYGGTNDQARRVASCLDKVEIMDLPVDGDNDMVKSTNQVLDKVAEMDAVPLIIAEIPTNPRVEVPNLKELNVALTKKRLTPKHKPAIEPVFILDQTFCPNYNFLGDDQIFSSVKTLSYVSGSKFPSGGKCTAGYVVANKPADSLMRYIEQNLVLCDNQATPHQMEILAEQLPSMTKRIAGAYKNTREFVNFIEGALPTAKINFVSEELATDGFTPSVFSLDLPTKGETPQERETYKRALNKKLINMMITQIPEESKYCVSYGQLKGCYWTIPATSTQGTTKEEDKDYIARVSVSPDLDLERHKKVFADFVSQLSEFELESQAL